MIFRSFQNAQNEEFYGATTPTPVPIHPNPRQSTPNPPQNHSPIHPQSTPNPHYWSIPIHPQLTHQTTTNARHWSTGYMDEMCAYHDRCFCLTAPVHAIIPPGW